MISSISPAHISNVKMGMASNSQPVKNNQTNAANNSFGFSSAASNALKLNGLNFARTIRFTGALQGAFQELNQSMVTCKTKDAKAKA